MDTSHGFLRRTGPLCLAVAALCFGYSPSAQAENITFAVIGPHEYDLPVDFKPFNALVQYGDGNAAGSTYDGQGRRQPTGGSHTWTGLTKYVYFRSFKAIPHVGFAFELIPTESFVLANGKNYGGMGPTIAGIATWFKPNHKSTFGIQVFFEAPLGTRQALSTNYWTNISTFFFDYEWKHFSFDGDLGAAPSSTLHVKGQHSYHPGTAFFTNLRFSWKASKLVEPFFALDWQNVMGTYDNTMSHWLPNTSSREVALGVGMMFNIAPNYSITARYSHSAEGRYTPETDAYYIKLLYLW